MIIDGQEFEITRCCACAVSVAIPKATFDMRYAKVRVEGSQWKGRLFWCSNGHSFYFPGESDADKLRRANERLAQKDAEIDDAHAAAAKAEAATARLKKRVSAGVCPHCTRTFGDLARHVKSKHPQQVCEVVPMKKPA